MEPNYREKAASIFNPNPQDTKVLKRADRLAQGFDACKYVAVAASIAAVSIAILASNSTQNPWFAPALGVASFTGIMWNFSRTDPTIQKQHTTAQRIIDHLETRQARKASRDLRNHVNPLN